MQQNSTKMKPEPPPPFQTDFSCAAEVSILSVSGSDKFRWVMAHGKRTHAPAEKDHASPKVTTTELAQGDPN